MLNKTLLGSAAVIMTMVGAQAADLPSKKAAPATYVKICDAYGAGFFFIPGSDTCVRVGGVVRAEYGYSQPAAAISMPTFGAGSVAGAGGYAARGSDANTAVWSMANPLGTVAAAAGSGANAQANQAATDTFNIAAQAARGNGITGVAISSTTGVITIQNGYAAGAFPNVALMPSATQDQTGFTSRGRIDIDARTPTSMGVVRTFMAIRVQSASGLYASNYSTTTNGGGALATGPTLENAIVQFAGITAGRTTTELFSFLPAYNYTSFSNAGFPGGINLLSYTAVLGGGMSATLGMEDRSGLSGFSTSPGFSPIGPGGTRALVPMNLLTTPITTTNNANTGGNNVFSLSGVNTGTNPGAFATGTNLAGTSLGGAANATGGMIGNGPYTLPNVVLAVRMDQAWGGAQLMGSIVQNGAQTTFAKTDPSSQLTTLTAAQGNATTPTAIAAGTPNITMTATGWAIGAGVKLNLPQIASGDVLYLTAAYGVGDLDHVLANNTSGSPSNMGREFGGLLRMDRNMYVTPSGAAGAGACASTATVNKGCFSTEQTRAWSVSGTFTHFWAPQWRSVFLGSYANITPPDRVRNTDWTLGGLSEARMTKVAGQLIYTPTKDFDIGLELSYLSLRQSLAATSVANGGTGVATAIPATWAGVVNSASSNVWQSRLRLQRTF